MKKKIEVNAKSVENWEVVWATSQGKRSANEDAMCVESEFCPAGTELESFFVGVFDGHNGARCSKFLAKEVFPTWREAAQHGLEDEIITRMFKDVDKKWLDMAAIEGWKDGSTGICAVLSHGELVVANVGDSRAILCEDGKTLPLSTDHKPTSPKEAERIERNGGRVIGGRLQAALDVSRSFGDIEFKKEKYLTSEPELTRHALSAESEFVVVSSDGLYEVFTNEEVIDWIRKGLKTKETQLSHLAHELIEEAIDRGAADNVSIVIVKFEKSFKRYLKKQHKSRSSSKKTSSLLPHSPKGISLRTSGKVPIHSLHPEIPPAMVRSAEPRKPSPLKTSGKNKIYSKSATNSSLPSPTHTPTQNSPTSSPTTARSFHFSPDSSCSIMHKLVEPYLEDQKKKSKSKLKKKEKVVKIDKDTQIHDKLSKGPHSSQSTSLRTSGRSILTKSG
eukprot:TRINITY_DN2564_c0_g1_i2.p1 TRINITY_DN2564_c0_g1~~TRINITY_DN2564_c0_g1_i2.p1  ORF type:complete len:447 (+),score=86.83 TRINITY_DN2564_c0_g1_i2:120-1460(+)